MVLAPCYTFFTLFSLPEHIEQVKARVPGDKLLVFDVKQGWEPLCRFLGVEAPDKPFPHLLDTEAFRERVRAMRAQPAGPATE